MDNRIKKMVWNIVIAALCVVVVSGIIILKPWQQEEQPIKENLLSLGIQEQRDGIEEALEHQYPNLKDVKVEQGAYSLDLYNMTVEEGRCHFEAKVTFPEEKKDSPKAIANEEQQPSTSSQEQGNGIGAAPDTQNIETNPPVRMKGAYFKVFLVDSLDFNKRKEISASYEAVPTKEENVVVYKLDGILTSDDLKFLIRKNQKLVIQSSFYDSDIDNLVDYEGISQYPHHPFKDVMLDVSEENWKISVHYPINQEIPTEYGSIIVDELIVGPSQMILTTRNALEKGYSLKAFEGGKLIASNGKIYGLQRSYAFEGSPEGKMHFYFNPSNYFEVDQQKEYTFQFDNIVLNDNREDKLVLSKQGAYPQVHRILGQEVVIESFKYEEASGMLELDMIYNPELISLDMYMAESSSRVFSPPVLQETTRINPKSREKEVVQTTILPAKLKFHVQNKNEYTLLINHNDFYVNKSGELKIKGQ